MRIALVTETFPPEVNGVAMTLQRWASGLVARGHRVTVVRPRQGRSDRPTDDPQMPQRLVAGMPLPGYRGLKMGLPCRGRLLRWWRRDRPELVHIATEGPLGLSALKAARRLGLPVSSTLHTNFHTYMGHYGAGILGGTTTRYLRWFHNRTDRTIVPTHDLAQKLASGGFARLEVVGRGIDTELFSPARRSDDLRRRWGAGPNDPVVLYVGRIAPEKNLAVLVRVFEAIHAAEPRARFVLVGDGPAAAALRRRHPGFVHAGVRRGPELGAHYASADLFVFASLTETFGNVVTEAMASGLAVVAYDYAAPRQHIEHNVNGLLAPFDDTAALTGLAADLARDAERFRRLGQAARRTAEAVTWPAVTEQLESILLRVASGD